jgi:hypothetical protein
MEGVPRITVYLDPKTMGLVETAAGRAGVSRSSWIADVVRGKCSDEWSQEVKDLADAWSDFPDLDEIRTFDVPDCPREP